MLSLFLLCQGPRLWSSAHKTLPSHTRAIPQHQDRSPALMVEGDPPWGLYHAGVSSQGQLWDHLYPFCQGLRTHSALLWPYRDRTTGFSLPSCRVHTSQCHPSEGLQDWYLWPWHISLPALPKSSPGEAERPEPLRLQQNQMGEKHQGLGKPPQPASQSQHSFSLLLRALQHWLADVLLTNARGISIHRLCHGLHHHCRNLKARNEKWQEILEITAGSWKGPVSHVRFSWMKESDSLSRWTRVNLGGLALQKHNVTYLMQKEL